MENNYMDTNYEINNEVEIQEEVTTEVQKSFAAELAEEIAKGILVTIGVAVGTGVLRFGYKKITKWNHNRVAIRKAKEEELKRVAETIADAIIEEVEVVEES